MKKLLLFLYCILFSGMAFASKKPAIYVAAINGISLREAPNKNSTKIETLTYGTRISNYNYTEEWDTIDGYYNNWIRVAVNGKDGYIFKGYTIPVQPPLTSNSMSEYLSLITGEKGIQDSVLLSQGEWMFNYRYRKFISYSFQCDMYCSYSISNLNMSVQEAYLMLYLLEYYNRNIWDEFYSLSSTEPQQILSSSFPGAKNKNIKVNDYDSFVYNTQFFVLSIIRAGSLVNVSWIMYP